MLIDLSMMEPLPTGFFQYFPIIGVRDVNQGFGSLTEILSI
jgi:hypothetical protein